jgi:hypothetical protein
MSSPLIYLNCIICPDLRSLYENRTFWLVVVKIYGTSEITYWMSDVEFHLNIETYQTFQGATLQYLLKYLLSTVQN